PSYRPASSCVRSCRCGPGRTCATTPTRRGSPPGTWSTSAAAAGAWKGRRAVRWRLAPRGAALGDGVRGYRKRAARAAGEHWTGARYPLERAVAVHRRARPHLHGAANECTAIRSGASEYDVTRRGEDGGGDGALGAGDEGRLLRAARDVDADVLRLRRRRRADLRAAAEDDL